MMLNGMLHNHLEKDTYRWIGYSDICKDGKFTNVDGKVVTYKKWNQITWAVQQSCKNMNTVSNSGQMVYGMILCVNCPTNTCVVLQVFVVRAFVVFSCDNKIQENMYSEKIFSSKSFDLSSIVFCFLKKWNLQHDRLNLQ